MYTVYINIIYTVYNLYILRMIHTQMADDGVGCRSDPTIGLLYTEHATQRCEPHSIVLLQRGWIHSWRRPQTAETETVYEVKWNEVKWIVIKRYSVWKKKVGRLEVFRNGNYVYIYITYKHIHNVYKMYIYTVYVYILCLVKENKKCDSKYCWFVLLRGRIRCYFISFFLYIYILYTHYIYYIYSVKEEWVLFRIRRRLTRIRYSNLLLSQTIGLMYSIYK